MDEATTHPRVLLYEHRDGDERRSTEAYTARDGSLVLSTTDGGPGVEAWWGDRDYEFWTTVAPEHRDALLMALVAHTFGGRASAVDDFRTFCAQHGIPCAFESWV